MVAPGDHGKSDELLGVYEVVEVGQTFAKVRYLDGPSKDKECFILLEVVGKGVAALRNSASGAFAAANSSEVAPATTLRFLAPNRSEHERREAEEVARGIYSYDELIVRARFHREKGELGAAGVYALRAAEVSNGKDGYLVSLAATFRAMMRHDKVDELLDPLLARCRSSGALNVKVGSLGDRARHDEAYPLACESLQVAGERQPDRSHSLKTLGRAAYNVGKLEEAEWCFEQAGDTSTGWHDLLQRLVLGYQERGNEVGANRVKRLISRHLPRSA